MKSLKRILILLLALTLTFALVACGGGEDACKHKDKDKDGLCDECDECTGHEDDDEDGLCDYCDEEMEDEGGEPSGDGIALTQDGELLFSVVLGDDITSSIKMSLDDIVEALDELGVTLDVSTDKNGKEADIEVLVGTVTSRGKEYNYDKHTLGYEGYAITAIDETKIVVTGGSDEALYTAFTKFFEDYLGFGSDMDEIEDFVFTEEFDEVAVQDDYRITSVKIDGNDARDYTISRDRADGVTDALAVKLQSFLYEQAGIWLDIVNPADAGEKTIGFRVVEKGKAGAKGFRVIIDDGNLLLECAHKTKFDEMFNEFYSVFSRQSGSITLEEFESDKDITCVYYKDYGAVGDGKTDDTAAIRAAHQEANESNQTVYGEKGKTYLITKCSKPIEIKTETDWRGATFIFDATTFKAEDSGNVFLIANDLPSFNISNQNDEILKNINNAKDENGLVIRGIDHGDSQTTKLDVGVREPLMLKVYNSEARTYIRWGTDTKGDEQCEIVIVDENGNLDPSTPFLLDYEKVTKIVAYRISATPISVKNATIISRNSLVNLLGGYKTLSHGIEVTRPNTTIENITHKIENEYAYDVPTRMDEKTGLWYDVSSEGFKYEKNKGGKYGFTKDGKAYDGSDVRQFTGYSYTGIINVSSAHNTLVKNCVFQARYHYEEGTYDISCSYSNQTEFRNCTQSNFFMKDENGNDTKQANIGTYWGISGTNYCKNLYFVDSTLTRFDAHCGVFNGGVKGGKISVIRLIGGGTFTLDGVEFYARQTPIQLREDYGATFNGTLIIKDVYFRDIWNNFSQKKDWNMTLIDAPTANHYNGYIAHFPNIIIENIEVETTGEKVWLTTLNNQTFITDGKYDLPSRCIIRDNVHDPDMLGEFFYSTKKPNIVEEEPDKFPHLAGRTKNTKLKPTEYKKLTANEYMVVDNGGTYIIVATHAKNVQPYAPPEFIKINMESSKNMNGKSLKLVMYKSSFFDNTEITDDGKVIEWITAPKK